MLIQIRKEKASMYTDDVQWAYNRTSGVYEIYCYNLTGQASRVVTLEMLPMQLHNLGIRLAQTVERDFPRAEPPMGGKPQHEESRESTELPEKQENQD